MRESVREERVWGREREREKKRRRGKGGKRGGRLWVWGRGLTDGNMGEELEMRRRGSRAI